MATLEFTLRVNNCLGCHVCPQDKLGAAYKSDVRVMSPETFVTILGKLPLAVRLDFSGFNEPYLHPNCHSFIIMALTRGNPVHVYSTLIGMRANQAKDLAVHEPQFFRVHVPDQKHLLLNDNLWIRQHELFLTSGIKGSYMAMEQLTPKVAEHLKNKGIEVELPHMISRAGNLEFMRPEKKLGPIRCFANRWHCNVVLPNGDIVGCCMDWSLTLPVGNLLAQSYDEIYEAAQRYEDNLNPPDDSICRTCEWSESIK